MQPQAWARSWGTGCTEWSGQEQPTPAAHPARKRLQVQNRTAHLVRRFILNLPVERPLRVGQVSNLPLFAPGEFYAATRSLGMHAGLFFFGWLSVSAGTSAGLPKKRGEPTPRHVRGESVFAVRKDRQVEPRLPVGGGGAMWMRRGLFGALLFLVAFGPFRTVRAQAPPTLPFLNGGSSTDTLSATLRGLLVENIPPVLLEDNRHWRQQKLGTRGVEWPGKRQPLTQEQESYKTHGVWRRTNATADQKSDTQGFDLR